MPCVKSETAHKDLQSGLVQVRTDRLYWEVCLFKAKSFKSRCHGVPK